MVTGRLSRFSPKDTGALLEEAPDALHAASTVPVHGHTMLAIGGTDSVIRLRTLGWSWRQAIARVGRFLADVPMRWYGQRVLVIGHVATRWALDHLVNGVPLEELVAADFEWREGWEYQFSSA